MFEISRPDGRSNQQVIIDMVRLAEPGTVFGFSEFQTVLEKDTPQRFPATRISAVVRQANVRLLKEVQRELMSVRGEGYKLAFAREHMVLASIRERKADRQMNRGYLTLKHVRDEELTDNERKLHYGHLMLASGIAAHVNLMRARERARDQAIADLRVQVEKLAQRTNSV